MQSAQEILKSVFGYNQFRLQQENVVQNTLLKKDSLVIMPTGGGKSICYQVPALLFKGVTVVVSPLIALMKDQVESLKNNGIEAISFNSTISNEEEYEAWQKIRDKKVKILYISPEKAVSPYFVQQLSDVHVDQFAIDEAHCVSIWGNDFRPEYAKLTGLLHQHPDAAWVALTATADKATQEDIVKNLQLRSPEKYLSSFERKNLNVKVQPAQNRVDKIFKFLEKRPEQSGIIYCLSRKSTEDLANKLNNRGFKAAFYHGALPTDKRNKVQEGFLKDETQIICATIAFGMGIDKSNIRWVIHYNMPKNTESYYQEIGRAGRDGAEADTLLFFTVRDYMVLRGFVEDSEASEEFKGVQLAKLNRMMEYCQATSCRTNFVLSYFGEHRSEGCGRCDNCVSPPEGFDGTILAQKALSAAKRLGQNVAMNLLANVLIGSKNKDVISNGFDKIKTYGAGADQSYKNWIQYITQMVNQGLFEIDFTDNHKLKLTPLAHEVLFQNVPITLHKVSELKNTTNRQKPEKKTAVFEKDLEVRLKIVRRQLAEKYNTLPYMVFSDKSLHDLVEKRPLNLFDLDDVYGFGDYKKNEYGHEIVDAIQDFIASQDTLKSVKGKTYLETFQLYRKGLSPEDIAKQRGINIITVFSHLANLYEKGENIDITQFITLNQVDTINKVWFELGQPNELKPIYEKLEGSIEYNQIRLALAYIKRSMKVT